MLLEVPAATHAPVKAGGIAYIRIGETTPPLSRFPEREKALWGKLQSFAWETGCRRAGSSRVNDPRAPRLSCLFPADKAAAARRPCRHPGGSGRREDHHPGCRRSLEHHQPGRRPVRFRSGPPGPLSAQGRSASSNTRGNPASAPAESRSGGSGYAVGFEQLISFITALLPSNELIGEALRTERTTIRRSPSANWSPTRSSIKT